MPFNENLFNKSNELVKKHNLSVKLAPRPVQKSSRIVFASVKDHADVSNMKNCMFAVKCKQCEFKIWFKTSNLDVERTMKGKFVCKDSKIKEHMNKNKEHEIPFSVYEMRSYENVYDLNIAFNSKMKNGNVN